MLDVGFPRLPIDFPWVWEASDIDSIRALADSSHFPITPSANLWITSGATGRLG
jgi:hypothetical protein